MNANEFYRQRDDRTNACTDRHTYSERTVSISIDGKEATTYAGQVAFVITANLIARWCRRIRIVAPRAMIHPRLACLLVSPPDDLGAFTLAVAKAADPFGDFILDEQRDSNVRVHVGVHRAPPRAIRICGRGWLAWGGAGVDAAHGRDDEALGAVLAACTGTAWAFRAALDEKLPESVILSLWNLRGGQAALDGPPVTAPDLGRALLVGCGAVGSSMAYLFPLVGICGALLVLDADAVDVTNLNRSPLFTLADVGKRKCDVVSAFLRRAGAEAKPLALWFDEAVSRRLIFEQRPDVVIPVANDRNVRHLIQHQVPPLQVYGTTGRDWQAFLGRHIPLQEDCLACRFPISAPQAPQLVCATGTIGAPEDVEPRRDAALPFLSTAASVMAVAELVKATYREFPVNANFVCLDFRGPLTDFLAVQRPAVERCTCRTQEPIWMKLNGVTRFAAPSAAAS